jgi:hypothetical protein
MLFMGALPQQSPLRRMEQHTALVQQPAIGRRRISAASIRMIQQAWPWPMIAIRRADNVNSCGIVSLIAQPTTVREQIDHDSQIEPSLDRHSAGDVGKPYRP